MAVSTPLSDAKLNAYDYSSPQVLQAQQAANQAAQAGYQQGAQGVQSQSDAKLKALLEGQQTEKKQLMDKSMLDQLSKENPGAQVKAGDLSKGVDPGVQMQAKMMATTKKEYDSLNTNFQKPMAELSTKAQQIQDGLTGLAQGTKEGDQAAISNITKLADGKGTRLTLALLNKFAPSNIQNDAEKMANYFTGLSVSGLPPAVHEALIQAYKGHAENLNNDYKDAEAEFQQKAPHFAPTLAAGGQLGSYVKDFGIAQSAKLDRINKLTSSLGQPQQMASAPAQAAPHGLLENIADKGRSLKDFLLGGPSQPTATAASPPPPPQAGPAAGASPPGQAMPVGPSGFDPDAFLGGK